MIRTARPDDVPVLLELVHVLLGIWVLAKSFIDLLTEKLCLSLQSRKRKLHTKQRGNSAEESHGNLRIGRRGDVVRHIAPQAAGGDASFGEHVAHDPHDPSRPLVARPLDLELRELGR